MAVFRLITSVVPLLLLAHGARISHKGQLGERFESETQVEPEYVKGVKYACVQKYETTWSKFVKKYCLANLEFALSIAEDHLQFGESITTCEESQGMRLCAGKGDAPEARTISFRKYMHVPKYCFRFSTGNDGREVIEAIADAASECTPAEGILPALEPETIVPEAIKAPTTPKEKEEDDVVEVEPAAVEDDVSTEVADELVEAKSLFTSGEDFFWEYRGTAMKCCVSTAGKPTQLQDMNQELPSARSYGTMTGCGRLFGDTYHNGLKSYKGSDPTCPLPASLLAGMTFEAKGLFTSGDESMWQYKDKAIKCCVSSDGKPTMLQDMSAEPLPSARMTGTTTGCGRMFGDTYHNGMGSHFPEPSCPIPLTLLMETVGDDFGSIASFLE